MSCHRVRHLVHGLLKQLGEGNFVHLLLHVLVVVYQNVTVDVDFGNARCDELPGKGLGESIDAVKHDENPSGGCHSVNVGESAVVSIRRM